MSKNKEIEELINNLRNIKPSYNNIFGKTITGLTNSGSLPSTEVINSLNEKTGRLSASLDSNDVENIKIIANDIEGDLRLLVTLNELDSNHAESLIDQLKSL